MRYRAFAVLAVAACGESPAATGPKAEPAPQHASAATIPDGPVRGTLAGRPFEARAAFYRVYRQLGREHVDLVLSGTQHDDPCAGSGAEPSVWIRFAGAEEPAPGERRRAAGGSSDWAVHYQTRTEGGWVGRSSAAALLSLETVKRGALIEGDLSACFSDEARSCVAGHFRAERCLDPLWPDARDLQPQRP